MNELFEDLKPYFIKLEVVPDTDKNVPQLENIKGAIAHIWVFETSKDRAQKKCIRYVHEYGWALKENAAVPEMQHMPLPLLDKQEAMNYRHAELLGINAHFVAYPKDNHSDENRVESLKRPPANYD